MATDLNPTLPRILPLTVAQYRLLVEQGEFDRSVGQIELINGKIVQKLPQGPVHSDPIDELEQWSHDVADKEYRIRIEKPIEIPQHNSTPEPDIAWVTKRRYADRHPLPGDIHLLIEVSKTSKAFDRGEKLDLYAVAGIREYWIVDVAAKTVEVFTNPDSGEYQQSALHSADEKISPQCLSDAVLDIARLFSKDV